MSTHSFYQVPSSRSWFHSETFENECFAVVRGREIHARFAAELVVESILLGYKILHARRFYHEAKYQLMLRLFSIGQKALKKAEDKHGQLACDIGIVCVGIKYLWIGILGDLTYFVNPKEMGNVDRIDKKGEFSVVEYTIAQVSHVIVGNNELISAIKPSWFKKDLDIPAEKLASYAKQENELGLMMITL